MDEEDDSWTDVNSEELNSSIHSNESEQTEAQNVTGQDLLTEFTCSVCFRIAVQPTTIMCGHTSCRLCLAKWYFSSKKKECPLCCQPYLGHPKINTHIRNMIVKLCPKELMELEKELLNSKEDMDLLKKYDEVLSKNVDSPNSPKNSKVFWYGLILAFCLLAFIAYPVSYLQSSERNLLIMKPVQLWKPQDVSDWLEDLHWASDYANKSLENNIDGNMLLAMDEDSMEQLLNVSDLMHKRALLLSIETLVIHGVKMPSTIWEYKALHPGLALFLIHGLRVYPRTTFLYLWMYFYEDTFLPFVKIVTKSADDIVNVSSSATLADTISTAQWINFLLLAAVFPQWHVIVLAYYSLSYNLISSLFIIVMAASIQILETLNIVSNSRNLSEWFTSYAFLLIQTFVIMVAWPIIPKFVCDIVFYHALYVRPFSNLLDVYRRVRQ